MLVGMKTDRQKRISKQRPRADQDRIGLGNQPVKVTRESVANDQRDDRARRLRALGEVAAELLARSHRGEP